MLKHDVGREYPLLQLRDRKPHQGAIIPYDNRLG